MRSSNLLVSTGAVGYVTERTFSHILADLGRNRIGDPGPFSVITILRMFDVAPIERCFSQVGLQLCPVPGVLLPQRAFANDSEKSEIITILRDRGVDTEGLESDGVLFAQLYVAAPPEEIDALLDRMREVAACDEPEPLLAAHVEVALAGCS